MCKTLSALPTAGVLKTGECAQILIAIADSCDENGKIEIAYVCIDDSIEQFNRKIYNASQKTSLQLCIVFR
ncbi:hypothetical protein OESDEN_15806 [Oesophagostomum dentatum]|uniref:Uncharacterized protein n=1 Tax=Oesophagostomum dentatum TaxID=61180 RepID=A0A0B1SHS9_OESDE|nr:hypothetical protein OESDEN_15806 [Oesophagostomum dentatum]